VEYTKNDKVEFGTQFIEDIIANPHDVKNNIESLVNSRFGIEGSKEIVIFDDISILAFEFFP
jgi:hypothetical protein